MRIFTGEKIIAIYRQTYSGSPATSSFSLVTTDTCYLRPLGEEASASNGIQYGYGFNILTEIYVDLREGDIVQIDSIEYTIRGIAKHDRGFNTQYLRAIATRSAQTVIPPATVGDLLNEDGSFLLLEDSSKILLES